MPGAETDAQLLAALQYEQEIESGMLNLGTQLGQGFR